jgi:hypothetical protein
VSELIDFFLHGDDEGNHRHRVIPVIDARGVGAGVFDALCDMGYNPLGIMATSGFEQGSRPTDKPQSRNGGKGWVMSVANHTLIRSLHAAAGEGYIGIAEGLELGDEIQRELVLTTPTLTDSKRSERFDAPSGEHDDLAAALMMGLFAARYLRDNPRYGQFIGAPLLPRGAGATGLRTQPAPSCAGWT